MIAVSKRDEKPSVHHAPLTALLGFLGSSSSLPLGPVFSNPLSLEKIFWPLNQVSRTTPLSVRFSYGEHLFRNSIVLGST